ncbi:insulin receptor substrate 1-B-like isoform X2 [Patiria miniata]|uniref:Insulin receptor substrate 1 n=1 Tax=Patiria miniata TaxID=46514 RepID=A0A913ZJN7_PATMI|nr:insulin receptor substrate 1-B-like isoform X2 [Patiria miniata]
MSSQKENIPGPGDGTDIVKCGYLKKFKTMRKKFFVLRCESSSGPARLEYYDTEKKFRAGALCKRTIDLKTCFNINKKTDSKQKHALSLYTRDDCFVVVAEDENSLNEWLQELLLQQQAENDGMPMPAFEHVWQVTVKPKGLGSSKGLSGNYRLCLTTTTVNLVKMNCENEDLEFSLSAIRRCGHSDCFFFMEVGRQSVTGTGEIWMQVEDTVIAQNIHEASLNAMRSISQQEEEMRPRSQSSGNTSETKPNSTRRQVATLGPSWRTRCESMPAQNRPRVARSRIGSESEESLQEEPSPTSASLGTTGTSSLLSSVIRPRTQSEGEGNHTARIGGSSLLKYGLKTRPRTASEGESHFRSGRTPESPTKARGRFAMPQRTGSGSLRPSSMHRVVQPISNSPPIPNSPLSESPLGVSEDRFLSYPQPLHASDPNLSDEFPGYGTSPSDHLLARFSGSGRSRTPDSPTRTPIREESVEFTDEYMNMAPSGASKAVLTVPVPTRQPLHHRTMNTQGRSPSPEHVYALLQPIHLTISPPSPQSPPSPPSGVHCSPPSPLHFPPPAPPDEDQSYMSMTPMSRSGSRGSSGYAPPTQAPPQLTQRSASVSGRLMTVPPSQDEGYMMMAPRKAQKRGSTGSREALKRGNTTEGRDGLKPPTADIDQAYTMMQPIPKHHGNSTVHDGTATKASGIAGNVPKAPTANSHREGKSRGSFSSPSSTKPLSFEAKMKPSEILVRSMSDSKEPILDTYMTMAFQPKNSKPKSPEIAKPGNVSPSLDNIDENDNPKSSYVNVSLPEASPKPKQPDSDYTFMVPSSRPANTRKDSDKGQSQSAVESLLKGSRKAEASRGSEYMNVDFSKGGVPGGELPVRPVPPIPARVPAGKREDGEYMNVEPGLGVRPHSPRSPTSPPVLPQRVVLPPRNPSTPPSLSPSLSGNGAGRRAADLKTGMEDLNLNEGSSPTSIGSAGSLTSGNKSCEPSPGPPSRHSSCRSSQTSLADRELNYIDVDIGQPDANSAPITLERRARSPFTRRAAEEDKSDKPTNYATIDFTKSEGLRSATTTRENRPL